MATKKINHDTTKENSFIVTIAIVATIFLLIVIFTFSFYFYKSLLSSSQNALQDNAKRHSYIVDIETKAKSELNTLKWVNKSKTLVQVPIDVAKENVIKDYN